MSFYIVTCWILHLSIFHVRAQTTGETLLPKECGQPPSDPFFQKQDPVSGYPWIAALFLGSQFVCAGSLINSRYVLTSASCLQGSSEPLTIRIGEWDLSKEEDCPRLTTGSQCLPLPVIASPEEIIVHPKFGNRTTYSDDIGLIRLNKSIDFESNEGLNPICLPPSDYKTPTVGAEAIAVGWGLSESNGKLSNILRSLAMPFADEQMCRDAYGEEFLEKDQLCVGRNGVDTCQGDGGGPLIMQGLSGTAFIQVGIVSYGFFPCKVYPAVYTSVSAYRKWILEKLKA